MRRSERGHTPLHIQATVLTRSLLNFGPQRFLGLCPFHLLLNLHPTSVNSRTSSGRPNAKRNRLERMLARTGRTRASIQIHLTALDGTRSLQGWDHGIQKNKMANHLCGMQSKCWEGETIKSIRNVQKNPWQIFPGVNNSKVSKVSRSELNSGTLGSEELTRNKHTNKKRKHQDAGSKWHLFFGQISP